MRAIAVRTVAENARSASGTAAFLGLYGATVPSRCLPGLRRTLLTGETLSARAAAGAGLILAGILVVQLKPSRNVA